MGKSKNLCVLAAPCKGDHLPRETPFLSFLPKCGLIRENFLLVILWEQ